MEPRSILFKDVSFNYDGSDRYILQGISAEILPGETVYVSGNSGGGKSTFLRLASGLLAPVSGDVFISGVDVRKAGKPALMELHREAAFIFQDSGLLNNMTMFDNLSLPLRYHTGMSETEISDHVLSVLKELHLEDDIHHFPNEMSRSERKLGSIARSLMTSPGIIYYDEPLEGLDYKTAEKVRRLIAKQGDEGRTIVIVEQDLGPALENADKIIILNNGKRDFYGTPIELKECCEPHIQNLVRRVAPRA